MNLGYLSIDLSIYRLIGLSRIMNLVASSVKQTLRRCYSRVKEHGIGKRKSSYTIEQLEKVFGQGGWDSQSCAPVLINSSGLYQEMESDSSTLEDFSQEDWCNQVLDSAFQEGDTETGEGHSSSEVTSAAALN